MWDFLTTLVTTLSGKEGQYVCGLWIILALAAGWIVMKRPAWFQALLDKITGKTPPVPPIVPG